MLRRTIFAILLFASVAWAANVKLYMAEGGFQIVREYEVQADRVRYYSVERGDWEEVPLALVDIKKTDAEAKARKEVFEKQAKEVAEEEIALKEERAEIRSIPTDPGAYMLENGKVRILPLGDWSMHNPKSRKLLKMLTPGMVDGVSLMELPGERSPNVVHGDRPEFFLQLSLDDSFGIVKVTGGKGVRVVEKVTVESLSKEIAEERELVKTFTKQLTQSGLYKIWPQDSLPKGEYAVIEYTEGKADARVWDFRIE